jgi:hypothetical protein
VLGNVSATKKKKPSNGNLMELVKIDIHQLCWEMCLKNLCSQIVLANAYLKNYISNCLLSLCLNIWAMWGLLAFVFTTAFLSIPYRDSVSHLASFSAFYSDAVLIQI